MIAGQSTGGMMNESELFDVIEGVHTIYAALLGMVITINFAMIVAV